MHRVLALALNALGMLSWSAAHALTFTVTNAEDSGPGSLRQAILDANGAAGADAIGVDAALESQAIVLTSGPLEIEDSVSMSGPGPDKLVVRSDDPEIDILKIGGNGVSVALTGIAIEGGEDGIQIDAGTNGSTIALTDVRIARQLADDGISVSGTLNRVRINGSILEGSEDNISVEGTKNAVLIVGSTIRLAKQDGIAAEGDGNALTVENSTINNNGEDASEPNDGIDVNGSRNTINLSQVTSSHNGEDGIDIEGSNNRVTVEHATIAFNGRDGIKLQDRSSTSRLTIYGSIVAGNGVPDVDGSVVSGGYNLIGAAKENSGFDAPGDQVGSPDRPIEPGLGPLHDHGGTTSVHALGAGSPALNAGDPSFAPPPEFDQRGTGFPRVLDGRVDIGAVEGAVR
jgi:hypothetical protein